MNNHRKLLIAILFGLMLFIQQPLNNTSFQKQPLILNSSDYKNQLLSDIQSESFHSDGFGSTDLTGSFNVRPYFPDISNDKNNEPTILRPSISYSSHSPIEISNDSDLAGFAVSGIGTENDPYLLDGWIITEVET